MKFIIGVLIMTFTVLSVCSRETQMIGCSTSQGARESCDSIIDICVEFHGHGYAYTFSYINGNIEECVSSLMKPDVTILRSSTKSLNDSIVAKLNRYIEYEEDNNWWHKNCMKYVEFMPWITVRLNKRHLFQSPIPVKSLKKSDDLPLLNDFLNLIFNNSMLRQQMSQYDGEGESEFLYSEVTDSIINIDIRNLDFVFQGSTTTFIKLSDNIIQVTYGSSSTSANQEIEIDRKTCEDLMRLSHFNGETVTQINEPSKTNYSNTPKIYIIKDGKPIYTCLNYQKDLELPQITCLLKVFTDIGINIKPSLKYFSDDNGE